MKKTMVEILLASYNGEAYIKEQINSILRQIDQNWHVTVSDEGSTDHTPEILDDYVLRYPEKISRVYSGKKFGNARDHFYWLIEQCSADYIFTCDQDDCWKPEKVRKTMERMAETENEYGKDTPILVFTDQTPTDAQLNPLAPSLMRYQNQFFEYFDYRSILMQNVVTGCAMCINRALAELARKCVDPAQTIMHDWWMTAVAARFGRIIYIDEPLSDYRQHGTNSVGAKDVRRIEYVAHMLTHLNGIRKGLQEKKIQAKIFVQTYEGIIGDEDRTFLEPFIKYRSGPLFYWKNRDLIHGIFRLTGMMILG